ncbi:MAG TPA: lipoate--protein ligase family protein [Candidatus Angelobacter sp.]|nr:lipoate--protein ligase family protein [Candidatus Angelobacter sp.]
MHFLDLTLATPAENLACDEALLDFFEERGGNGVLRFWEPGNYFVVVGYGNYVEKEADAAACAAGGIPIFRRCSGGGTVLQGPGCLNYSLVLKIEKDGPLHSITSANRFIMERNRGAIERLVSCSRGTGLSPVRAGTHGRDAHAPIAVQVRGHTDLALAADDSSLKFSGNAQRRKKSFLLFHGTFLLNFDISLIGRFLRMPSKEPDYRHGRSHEHFLTNLSLSAEAVKRALREAWPTEATLEAALDSAIALLARDKYETEGWNFKF